jgi:HAD superfamily hydrolase (TIGR01458 family)
MKGIRAFLIDLDGVLYVGSHPVEGAAEGIRTLRREGYGCRFISNTTRKSRYTIAQHLKGMGFFIEEEEIFTPAIAAAEWLKQQKANRCFFLTFGDVGRDFLGIPEAEGTGADFVVIGDAGDNFTYRHLNHAMRAVMDGAEILALEKDRYWMSTDGLALSAGPFVAALEFATGKQALLVGKPSLPFFNLALQELGARVNETAMIGDDINSDVGGAQKAGMMGILVRTGKFRREVVAASDIRPDLIIDSLADLPDYLLK